VFGPRLLPSEKLAAHVDHPKGNGGLVD